MVKKIYLTKAAFLVNTITKKCTNSRLYLGEFSETFMELVFPISFKLFQSVEQRKFFILKEISFESVKNTLLLTKVEQVMTLTYQPVCRRFLPDCN